MRTMFSQQQLSNETTGIFTCIKSTSPLTLSLSTLRNIYMTACAPIPYNPGKWIYQIAWSLSASMIGPLRINTTKASVGYP